MAKPSFPVCVCVHVCVHACYWSVLVELLHQWSCQVVSGCGVWCHGPSRTAETLLHGSSSWKKLLQHHKKKKSYIVHRICLQENYTLADLAEAKRKLLLERVYRQQDRCCRVWNPPDISKSPETGVLCVPTVRTKHREAAFSFYASTSLENKNLQNPRGLLQLSCFKSSLKVSLSSDAFLNKVLRFGLLSQTALYLSFICLNIF